MTSESVHFRVGNFSCVALPDVINTITEDDITSMFTNDTERMLTAKDRMHVPSFYRKTI